MKEVIYSSAERHELARKMQLFAMESIIDLAIKAAQKRIAEGRFEEPIELEGSVDGVDYLLHLGAEDSREDDLVLIDQLEE